MVHTKSHPTDVFFHVVEWLFLLSIYQINCFVLQNAMISSTYSFRHFRVRS